MLNRAKCLVRLSYGLLIEHMHGRYSSTLELVQRVYHACGLVVEIEHGSVRFSKATMSSCSKRSSSRSVQPKTNIQVKSQGRKID